MPCGYDRKVGGAKEREGGGGRGRELRDVGGARGVVSVASLEKSCDRHDVDILLSSHGALCVAAVTVLYVLNRGVPCCRVFFVFSRFLGGGGRGGERYFIFLIPLKTS